ncbi:MAG: hypothetical protein FWC54_06260, partial [Actinomycetia bacterium]|nr:hypothetical protein [Actinomycetes bacterium]
MNYTRPNAVFRRIVALSCAAALIFSLSSNLTPVKTAAAAGTPIYSNTADGLSFSINASTIPMRRQASDPGVGITITDTNAGSSSYQFSGLPYGTTMKVGGALLSASGIDLDGNPLFTLTPAQRAQSIELLLPIGWSGSVSNISLSRLSPGDNILTAFDNGTF